MIVALWSGSGPAPWPVQPFVSLRLGTKGAPHSKVDTAIRADAFVEGGSLAAGTAADASDVDVYAVTHAAACYQPVFTRRVAFVHSWLGRLLLLAALNFEDLGFDMPHSVLDDGVHGELALGHPNNFRVRM